MLDDCVLKLGNYPIIKAAFFIYLLFWWFVPTFAPHTALVTGRRDALPCHHLRAGFHPALGEARKGPASAGAGDQATASLGRRPERSWDGAQRGVAPRGCIRPAPGTERPKHGCTTRKTSLG